MKKHISFPVAVLLCLFLIKVTGAQNLSRPVKPKPRIVNIINFIRLLEPRDSAVTQDVLYNTVVNQVKLMQANKLGGTFLLQYDALMDTRYQQLLKSLGKEFEIGAWWEIPQPLVEKAGLLWRGRFPWDWHANVGFSTGYTPQEREQMVDVYMKDFKNIYGYYPKSVGSWFIDAHTINYLYSKYHIVASCNCKDQYGTDGYTLWGGYWNQAYYPSKINSYMPAQNSVNQTPVPIFRMLGSDPVRQYDNGLGTTWQGVITLEPVYENAGGDSSWIHWYFNQFVNGESMEFAYTQAGQENSFTWEGMKKGLSMQFPLIAKLRDEGKLLVQTLEESGKWFTKKYALTPATSVTVTKDLAGSNRKTVWFDSRFYRANLLWEDGGLKFRDIHLFNENFPSKYTEGIAVTNECAFYTLPVMDGYLWSKPNAIAGLHFMIEENGKKVLMKGGNPVVKNNARGKLTIIWPLQNHAGNVIMVFDEQQVSIQLRSKSLAKWSLEMTTAEGIVLPFKNITPKKVACVFENFDYSFSTVKGFFTNQNGKALIIQPENNKIILNLVADKSLLK